MASRSSAKSLSFYFHTWLGHNFNTSKFEVHSYRARCSLLPTIKETTARAVLGCGDIDSGIPQKHILTPPIHFQKEAVAKLLRARWSTNPGEELNANKTK